MILGQTTRAQFRKGARVRLRLDLPERGLFREDAGVVTQVLPLDLSVVSFTREDRSRAVVHGLDAGLLECRL